MSTLYRDYRPKKFSEVLGQNHVKITLQNEIMAGHPAHSYLFCGPRAVGKTTLARILAKTLNCQNRADSDFEPCNKCLSCESINKGKNLDVIEIDAASNTGVDNVRENIISFSRLSPNGNKYKVFIIDEVHMLSIQAFNALLKIMEEPPTYVVFVLCTTEIHKVPSTIISRCERFDFKKISVSEIVQKLKTIASEEKVDIEEGILQVIARQSGGYLRDAESLFGQVLSIGGKNIKSEQVELIIPRNYNDEALKIISLINKKDGGKAISLLNELIENGVDIKIFINELISLSRKILLDKVSPGLSDNLGLDLGEELEQKITDLVKSITKEKIILIIEKLLSLSSDLRNFLVPQLPLEIMIVELCLGSENISFKNDSSSLSTPEIKSFSKKEDVIKIDSVPKEKPILKEVEASEEKEDMPKVELMDNSEIMAKWPEFLIKLKKDNHSLSFIMQSCCPKEVKDGKLFLAFKYKFHQNRLNDAGIKDIIKNILKDVYGFRFDIETVIDEGMEIKNAFNPDFQPEEKPLETSSEEEKKPGTMLSGLLNAFGGEVIG